MDPLTIAAIASSLLGGLFGGGGEQERKPYSGLGGAQRTLEDALRGISTVGAGIEAKGPTQLRGYVPRGPSPVQIPGLPFQIGGGLGHDPALDDPTVLLGGGGGGLGSAFTNMAANMGTQGQRIGSGSAVKRVAPQAMQASATPGNVKQRKPEGLV
jgi:hypothetical protein